MAGKHWHDVADELLESFHNGNLADVHNELMRLPQDVALAVVARMMDALTALKAEGSAYEFSCEESSFMRLLSDGLGDLAVFPLTQWAKMAFSLLRKEGVPSFGDEEVGAEAVAITTGAHAFRIGLTEQELSRWLQGAYGSVWVVQQGLRPGLDMKDVREAALRGYAAARDLKEGR
jgi:hypothetical protein